MPLLSNPFQYHFFFHPHTSFSSTHSSHTPYFTSSHTLALPCSNKHFHIQILFYCLKGTHFFTDPHRCSQGLSLALSLSRSFPPSFSSLSLFSLPPLPFFHLQFDLFLTLLSSLLFPKLEHRNILSLMNIHSLVLALRNTVE